MKLIPAQVKWLNTELEVERRMVKQKFKNPFQGFAHRMRLDSLCIIRDLHNIAVKEGKKDASTIDRT